MNRMGGRRQMLVVEREKPRGKMFWVERVLCENNERGRG